ncbi:hypothetical protein C8J56DRAFT_934584 [Mycena floridula]|nr:hypothetical protein C8J56DRAFT_934584 [Mycena floridula]
MADSAPAVIDLTAVSSDDDIEIISGPSTSKKSPKKRRRKKSRQRESKAEGGREEGEIEEPREEEGRHRKRNRRSASPLDKRRSPSSPPTESFYTDFTPAKLPAAVQFHENESNGLEPDTIPLLLPSHVAVFDDDATQTLLPTQPDSDDDYIDYLDIDGPRDFVRYFDLADESANPVKRIKVCNACGGNHRRSECRVKICLTCGLRNGDHSTYSCPISKICFRCGLKGHIKPNCPNRAASQSEYPECRRCASQDHITEECPTWWRVYHYVEKEERDSTLALRQSKMNLELGQGGEGYIADDEWCYNCGGSGHWGDDCEEMPHINDIPIESSAFSSHNTSSGPFFDPHAKSRPTRIPRSLTRDWESSKNAPPDAVGKKNRDEQEDWFGSGRNVKNRGQSSRDSRPPKKMSFGPSKHDMGQSSSTKKPSLQQRMGMGSDRDFAPPTGPRSDFRRRHRDRSRDKGRDKERDKDRERSRDNDRSRHERKDYEPRYRGGYSR